MININTILEISRHFKGRYLITLKDVLKSSFVTSDTYKQELKDRFDL
jgi:DNA-binding LytR/AlgR family response regulator